MSSLSEALELGPMAKVARARLHDEEFRATLTTWAERTCPLALDHRADRARGVHSWTVRFRNQPPAELGVVLGDIVHNLRSALDHLVEVLVRHSGSVPTRTNHFPICRQASQFWGDRQGKNDPLAGMSEEWCEEIARWQPFATYPDSPNSDPLLLVAALDNADKHRHLLLLSACTALDMASLRGSFIFERDGTNVRTKVTTRAHFESGGEILEIRADPPGPLDADIDPRTMLDFEMAVVLPGREPTILPDFFDPVEQVITSFVPSLVAGGG